MANYIYYYIIIYVNIYIFILHIDATHLAKEKAKADADYYKAERESLANKVTFSIIVVELL